MLTAPQEKAVKSGKEKISNNRPECIGVASKEGENN
jgi:hypothetical protein